VQRQVSALPKPENGKSVTVEDVKPLLAEMVAAIPPAEPGKSVTIDDVKPLIEEAVAAIPKPENGKSVTLDEVRPLLQEMIDALPKAEPGKEGPPGKLPLIKEWEDRVHYEGEAVTLNGSTYQARKDTGRAPPHEDWICIAAAGQNGEDGKSLDVIGTFDPKRDYKRLNVVALNGASFVARKDNPGPCPGEGWQLIAAQGKRGNPGEPGKKGDTGPRGEAGSPVVAMAIDGQGLMTLANGDGSTVELDMYPLLSKLN